MEIKIENCNFQENRVVEDELKNNVIETIDTKSNVKTLTDFEDSFLPYEKKHSALLKKCQSIQQGNDRLVNRIHRVKRLLKQLRKEKRSLMMRLDHYGDEYKNVPLCNNEIQDTGGSTETASIKKSHSSISLSKPHQLSQASRSHQSGSTNISSKKRSSTNNKHHNTGSTPKMLHFDKEDKSGIPPIKRPANPFFLFCQEKRTAILDARQLQENKVELSHQELTRILAKNWNNLPIQEKKVYYRMYEKEKYRYEQELKALSTNLNSSCNSFTPDVVIKKEIMDS